MRQRGKKSCNRFCVCCEYKEPSTSLNRKTHGARFYDMEVFAIRSSVQAFLFPKKITTTWLSWCFHSHRVSSQNRHLWNTKFIIHPNVACSCYCRQLWVSIWDFWFYSKDRLIKSNRQASADPLKSLKKTRYTKIFGVNGSCISFYVVTHDPFNNNKESKRSMLHSNLRVTHIKTHWLKASLVKI